MIQKVAGLFGVVFLLIGVLGFLAGGMSMEADPARAPRVLGLFPVNVLHNAIHLLFGVWGLAASRTVSGASLFAKAAGAIYLVLAIAGFVIPTTFGLIPIGGHDIWLHALIGIVLLTVGLQAPKSVTT
jgi:DMSO/TMAO reductase YedYZ heme-binding membrane subunit